MNNMSSRLPNASTKVSIVQACFGLGATIAPFISTPFAQNIHRAYLYFLVAAGIALFVLVIVLLTIQGRTEAQCVGHLPLKQDEKRSAGDRAVLELEGQAPHPTASVVDHGGRLQTDPDRAGAITVQPEISSGAKMRLMFSTKATWTLVAYQFIYVRIPHLLLLRVLMATA